MSAFYCLIEAFSWLTRRGLGKYILTPLLINLSLFASATYGFIYYLDSLLNHFLPQGSWLSYLRWLLWPLIVLMLAIIIFYSFSLLANIIAAPFNGFLAQAVETIDSGQRPITNMTLSQEIWHSVKQELIKALFFLSRAIPIIILTFIPVINLLAPLLWFLYSAWVCYLQYMDYPMANNGIAFKQQRHLLKRQPLATFSFGGLASLMMMIPLLNLIAMPLSVIGATLYWSRHLKPNSQPTTGTNHAHIQPR